MSRKLDRIPPAIAYQQLVELGQRMDALMEQERQSAECAEISAWLDSDTGEPEGTEPSPVILGGEILYLTPSHSEEIPY